MAQSYDYVICGGGVAGLVLASRLSLLAPLSTILVLEAGTDPSATEAVTSARGVPIASQSEHTFQLALTPNKNLGGRGLVVPVGKALSGGAAVNSCTWTRGAKVDYDAWAEIVGDQEWSYEQLLPFFRRIENVALPAAGVRDEIQQGYDGYLKVVPRTAGSPSRRFPLRDKVLQAWGEAGVKYVGDGNRGQQNGVIDLVEVFVQGVRQLPYNVLDLHRVEVRSETTVQRVLTTGGRAVGVELNGGERISASKEVILSAGTYHTPKLLLLSGIGDPAELAKHGIAVVVASPDVGRNLRDHLAMATTWKLKNPELGLALGSPLLADPGFFEGWPAEFIHVANLNKNGTLKTLAENEEDRRYLCRPDASHYESIMLYASMPKPLSGVDAALDGSFVSSALVSLATTSRGTVTLASSNPTDPPVIDINFFDTAADRFLLREALRQNAKVWLETETAKSFISHEVPPEGYAAIDPHTSDADIDRRIEDFGFSFNHPMGTCAMGKVVDSHCRVKGVEGLRVVDASVFPLTMACQIQNAVYVLAERVAEWIAQEA